MSFSYAVSGADASSATAASIPALRDVSFDLEGGRVLLVVGPSGSGKSTLARAIAGLVPSEVPGEWHGSLEVGGLDVAVAPRLEVAARVGIVFQDPASQLVMERAGDDVAFGLENRAWPRDAMRARVPEALDAVGMAGFDERRSARLSGGEQQRLALAGVLASRPGLLVLDEPSANLDPHGASSLFARLADLRARRSTTIVLVEHRVDRSWDLADRVLALGPDGRPVASGATSSVLRRAHAALDAAGIWLPGATTAPGPTTAPGATTAPTTTGPAGPAGPTGPTGPTGAASESAAAPAVDAAPILDVHEAWHSYERGRPVLHGVSVLVRAGERVALTGPNGAGKSTLLRLVLGLARPIAGTVRVAGLDPSRLRPWALARRVGYVVQDPELGFVSDTVREELELGLEPSDLAAAYALAERLDLPIVRFGNRSPYRLSGGEQRRLSLVTALARRPPLLVLDEPTFGQDRHGHERLVGILEELAASGTAILAATHDDRFVRAFADRVVELDEGWLVEERAA